MSIGIIEQPFGPSTAPPKANGHDTDPQWPVLDKLAFHGLAGEIVTKLMPQTESDPAALLLQNLVSFGNVIGRGPHCQVGQDQHFSNLFSVLAGRSSKARKGLSGNLIRAYYKLVDPDWVHECVGGGMSSGEGIINDIRDPISTMRKGVLELTDVGVADKRLLLDEREFSSALAVLKREGNILSRVVRDAWDCIAVLRTRTKQSPIKATNPFIAIIGHITINELRAMLDQVSMANGYANRFLFACVRRSKVLPFGGDQVDMAGIGGKLQWAVEKARTAGLVGMNDSARGLWREVYPGLSEEKPGLLAAICARGEAQVLRLALIYALFDGANEIDSVHIEAALALWTFCADSARYIFGDLLGDTVADAILRALRTAGTSGLARTDIQQLFANNRSSGDISRALALLLEAGKARFTRTPQAIGGARRKLGLRSNSTDSKYEINTK